MENNNEVLLKVEHLCQYFKLGRRDFKAVDDVSFEIKKGEILGLFGLMGAGRTSAVKGIFGDLYLRSGSIEKDGKKMWEFTVGEIINDKITKKAILKGIKGKVYRSDGNYIDINAEGGSMKMGTNDFALEGTVKAINSNGGKLLADKVEWIQKGEKIIATGNVKLYKDEWFASADKAETTSSFNNLKLKGNAMVEKGGDNQ